MDRFSCCLISLPGLPTALQVAETLLLRHAGLPDLKPEDIVSGHGPQFTSRVWWAFLKKLGVTVSLPSGYQPQSNWQVERMNQGLGRFLMRHCQDRQGEWAHFLPWAQNSLLSHLLLLLPSGVQRQLKTNHRSCGSSLHIPCTHYLHLWIIMIHTIKCITSSPLCHSPMFTHQLVLFLFISVLPR
jgi:hypothetical protein